MHVNTQIYTCLASALHPPHPYPEPCCSRQLLRPCFCAPAQPQPQSSTWTRYLGQDRCVAGLTWSHPCFPISLCTLSIKVGLFLSCVLDFVYFLYFPEKVWLFPEPGACLSLPKLHLPGALALRVSPRSAFKVKYPEEGE